MLIDLTLISIAIDNQQYPGEMVFRVISKNPLEEPPLVIAELDDPSDYISIEDEDPGDDDQFTTGVEGAILPYLEEGAPATATVHLYRLPKKEQQYAVASWWKESNLYVGYGISVEVHDGAYWIAILNEEDMSIDSNGESYREIKYEIYESLPSAGQGAASCCVRLKVP